MVVVVVVAWGSSRAVADGVFRGGVHVGPGPTLCCAVVTTPEADACEGTEGGEEDGGWGDYRGRQVKPTPSCEKDVDDREAYVAGQYCVGVARVGRLAYDAGWEESDDEGDQKED